MYDCSNDHFPCGLEYSVFGLDTFGTSPFMQSLKGWQVG